MKAKLLILFGSAAMVIAPAIPMVLIALLAIILDTVFGVWRTIKKNGRASLESRKFRATIEKTFLYCGAILFVFGIEKYIAGDIVAHFISVDLLLTKAFAFYCVYTEVKSMNESYKDVTGRDVLAGFRKFVSGIKTEGDKWK